MDQLRPPGAAERFPPPRRHSTVPTTFQPATPRNAPAERSQTSGGSVETLFSHPSVKIVAFSAGTSAFDRLGAGQDEKPGSLQPSSHFERTIAIGGFQIYRAPGSVAFLRSGSALQPILPKSQCWCLDEQSSKFILQIRRPNYWRIEVPIDNEEEIRRALILREVLDRVLQLEKTPCPFERSFTVELPARPHTPPKKRPWTPTAPTRSVSMKWPPDSPVTPPPEFPTRGRFYNPAARRFSDFGVDTKKNSSILGTPPRISEKQEEQDDAEEQNEAPSTRSHIESGAMILGKPELLSPPPTAIPISISEMTKEAISPEVMARRFETSEERTESAVAAPAQSKPEAPSRPQEPMWFMKKVPAEANRKAKRVSPPPSKPIAIKSSPSKEPHSTQARPQAKPKHTPSKDSTQSESFALPSKMSSPNGSTDGSDIRSSDSLEGSGQLRVKRTRVAAFASRRAAKTPPLKLRTSSTSTCSSASVSHAEKITETGIPQPSSPADSSDSFHSIESHQSWHSPISPILDLPQASPTKTYPYPHDNIPLAPHMRKGQMSDFTTTPTAAGWERNSIGAVVGSGANTPSTPFTEFPDEEPKGKDAAQGLVKYPKNIAEHVVEEGPADSPSEGSNSSLASSWSSAASWNSSNSRPSMRHRAATTSVAISHTSPRALSPLPPAANLLLATDPIGRASTAVRAIRRIPSSIFNKTCEILISPPAHLISLMLKAAARITAGEWQGLVFGMGEGGEVVDIRWDWSDEGDIDGLMLEGWEESDFDFSNVRQQQQQRNKSRVASFTAGETPRPSAGLSQGVTSPRVRVEYQDPWATPPDEPDLDEEEHWSRSWGVD